MISAATRRTLFQKLEEYEGRIPHLYLDDRGNVTVGVGHLISTLARAQALPFVAGNHKRASRLEIEADWTAVRKMGLGGFELRASAYRRCTKLSLENVEIDRLTNEHIESFERELKNIYLGFLLFSSSAQLALFDMIFNLGGTKLRNVFVNLNKAVRAKDWVQAGKESNRKRQPLRRNQYVLELFNKAAVQQKLAAPQPSIGP